MKIIILCPIESVDTLVIFVTQLCKLKADIDDGGQLESIAPSAHQPPVVVKIISKSVQVA